MVVPHFPELVSAEARMEPVLCGTLVAQQGSSHHHQLEIPTPPSHAIPISKPNVPRHVMEQLRPRGQAQGTVSTCRHTSGTSSPSPSASSRVLPAGAAGLSQHTRERRSGSDPALPGSAEPQGSTRHSAGARPQLLAAAAAAPV